MTAVLFKSPGLFSVFLADLNYILPCCSQLLILFSNLPPPLTNSKGLFQGNQLQLLSHFPSNSIAFRSLTRAIYLSFISRFRNIIIWSTSRFSRGFFFFFFFFYFAVVDYLQVWSSGQIDVICLYFKTPKKFVCLNLQDRFRIVLITFARKVKFQFLAQLSVNHLPYILVSSFIVFFVLICCISLIYIFSMVFLVISLSSLLLWEIWITLQVD